MSRVRKSQALQTTQQFPGASAVVNPVFVSNDSILKNKLNNLSEPPPHGGQRHLMGATDRFGNPFTHNTVEFIKGVTNSKMLRNSKGLTEIAPTQPTLNKKMIDILNSGKLPDYIQQNKGAANIDVAILELLAPINAKLITVTLIQQKLVGSNHLVNFPGPSGARNLQAKLLYEQLTSDYANLMAMPYSPEQKEAVAMQMINKYVDSLETIFNPRGPVLAGFIKIDMRAQADPAQLVHALQQLQGMSGALGRLRAGPAPGANLEAPVSALAGQISAVQAQIQQADIAARAAAQAAAAAAAAAPLGAVAAAPLIAGGPQPLGAGVSMIAAAMNMAAGRPLAGVPPGMPVVGAGGYYAPAAPAVQGVRPGLGPAIPIVPIQAPFLQAQPAGAAAAPPAWADPAAAAAEVKAEEEAKEEEAKVAAEERKVMEEKEREQKDEDRRKLEIKTGFDLLGKRNPTIADARTVLWAFQLLSERGERPDAAASSAGVMFMNNVQRKMFGKNVAEAISDLKQLNGWIVKNVDSPTGDYNQFVGKASAAKYNGLLTNIVRATRMMRGNRADIDVYKYNDRDGFEPDAARRNDK